MTAINTDGLYQRLAAPVPASAIEWRQDGKVIAKDGKFFARFVAYIEANTVRERLDSVVPGEWDLTLDLLPPSHDTDGVETCAFKARLQILGVIREDVGSGDSYKSAATDAFKRAGVRFGIGHELYGFGMNWVQMDGDGKYAKPVEDPGVAYARKHAGNGQRPTPAPATETRAATPPSSAPTSGEAEPSDTPTDRIVENAEAPNCPKCGGRMWDNRLSKRNPKAPDFKCRDRACDGVVWPAKKANGKGKQETSLGDMPELDVSPVGMSLDDIPF